jgi:hypothetical protein
MLLLKGVTVEDRCHVYEVAGLIERLDGCLGLKLLTVHDSQHFLSFTPPPSDYFS